MAPSECVYSRWNGPKCADSIIRSKEDGSDCSIFAFDVTADKSRLPLARNAVRKMRTLRHPGVIKVYDTVEVIPAYRKEGSFRPSLMMYDRPRHTYTLPPRE